jgi:tetratricopeptide (TPR) repeat protein/tRNA A-37 threonylcarbamoyl transferase component Bud32
MLPEISGALSQQVDAAIAEYLNAVNRGGAPTREEFISQHQEIAAELGQFLDDHQAIDQAARAAVVESTRGNAYSTGRAAVGSRRPLTGSKQFGEFELVEEIARGGMGVVYKARQSTPSRTVALKMILAGQFASRADVDRFYAEAHAAASLDHPLIVPIFAFGECEGQHYFTMAFVEGMSLGQRLAGGPLPPKEAVTIIRDAATAVEYAHQHGVIHRDLKPANILVDLDSRVRVTDFGLAKRQADDSGLTRTGEVLGTPSFMAPEQISGDPVRVGPAADVYALAATLYALMTGRPPFQAASTVDTLKQVLEQAPVSPRALNSSISRDLETIVLKCLDKPAARRYASARELGDDLNRYLEGRPIKARPVGRGEHVWRWCCRNPAVAALVGLVFGVLIAGIITSSYFAATASHEAKVAVEALDQAESQRHIAEGVNKFFADDVIGLASPLRFKRAGISLKEAIDVAATKVDDRFPDEPQLRAVLYDRLGDVYFGTDQKDKAAVQFEKAAKLWESLFGRLDQRTLHSRSEWGAVAGGKSLAILESTLADQTRVLGPTHIDTLGTAFNLAFNLMSAHDPKDLEFTQDVYERSLAALGPRNVMTLKLQYVLSWILRWRGKYEEALVHAKPAALGLRELSGSDDVDAMLASYNYAACLQTAHRSEEAAAELKIVHDARMRVLGPSHTTTQFTTWRLVSVLQHLGRTPEAIEIVNDVARRVDDGRNTDFYMLASAFAEIEDHKSAVKWLQRTADLHPNDARAFSVAAREQLSAGDVQGYREGCADMARRFSAGDEAAQFWLAWTCGLGPTALADLRQPIAKARGLVARDPNSADHLAALGMLLYRSGNYEEAKNRISESISKYTDRAEGSVVDAQFLDAMLEWRLGRKEEASQAYAKGLELEKEKTTSMADWNRRATIALFRREAEGLIGQATGAGAAH